MVKLVVLLHLYHVKSRQSHDVIRQKCSFVDITNVHGAVSDEGAEQGEGKITQDTSDIHCHNASLFHFSGNPMAATSTMGYSSSRALNLSTMSF